MQTYILKLTKFSFSRVKPKLYIFAGQGTQEKGMLKDLIQISQAKSQIEKLSEKVGLNFIEISSTDSQNQINKTKITQPLLVLSQTLRFKYLNKQKLNENDFMIGHSIGEYSALCISQSIGLEECLRIVKKRGQLMQQHTTQPSGMLIVRFSDQNKQKVRSIIKQCDLSIACFNTPNNNNIAGSLSKLQKARSLFRQNKITCLFLPVSSAFHCDMLSTMRQPYRQYLKSFNFNKPKAKILRNFDAKIYHESKDIVQGLVQHLTNPVQFQKAIKQVDPQIQCIQIGHNQIVRKFFEETRKKMKNLNR